MKNNLTIFVYSCDSYEDAWYPFFKLLDKYWPDCPYDIVLNTESKDCQVELKNIKVQTFNLFKPGEKVPYGERVLRHLEKIKTDYVLTIMDDFFIRSQVDGETIGKIVAYMEEDPKIASFCLIHHNDKYNPRLAYQEKGFDGYSMRPRFAHFCYDMQVSIWRKEALVQSWQKWYSPWEWEGPANVRSFDDGYKYYDKDCYTPFAIDYIDYKKDEWSGICKGKWVKETVVPLFEKEGIMVDYSIRGFFTPSTGIKKSMGLKKHLINSLREARAYGWRRCLPATLYRLRYAISSRLNQNTSLPDNYTDYLRRKFYEKS